MRPGIGQVADRPHEGGGRRRGADQGERWPSTTRSCPRRSRSTARPKAPRRGQDAVLPEHGSPPLAAQPRPPPPRGRERLRLRRQQLPLRPRGRPIPRPPPSPGTATSRSSPTRPPTPRGDPEVGPRRDRRSTRTWEALRARGERGRDRASDAGCNSHRLVVVARAGRRPLARSCSSGPGRTPGRWIPDGRHRPRGGLPTAPATRARAGWPSCSPARGRNTSACSASLACGFPGMIRTLALGERAGPGRRPGPGRLQSIRTPPSTTRPERRARATRSGLDRPGPARHRCRQPGGLSPARRVRTATRRPGRTQLRRADRPLRRRAGSPSADFASIWRGCGAA